MKLKNWIKWSKDEKPLERIPADGGYCAIFRTIGCVGDSLSSGEFEGTDEKGERTYHDMFEYSWGQFLARMTGSKVYNFSRGGMSAKEYCESFGEANDFWNPDKACEAYIIALACNDLGGLKMEPGSIADVCDEDWHQNKPTYAGYYGQLVQRLREIRPDAKFFFVTVPKDTHRNDDLSAMVPLMYDMAAHFPNSYVIDLDRYAPVYDDDFYAKFFMGGHMNPMGYLLTAKMIAAYIDWIVRHNMGDFKQLGFIGTPYRNTADPTVTA